MESRSIINKDNHLYISNEKEQFNVNYVYYLNSFADFWYHVIGVNVIPAITRIKKTYEEWLPYQIESVSIEQYEEWKREGAFKYGFMIMPGRVFRSSQIGRYLIGIDCDKPPSFEFIKSTIKKHDLDARDYFIIEQHKDNPQKAHFYFFSDIPYPKKNRDQVIGLEIACEGNDKLMCCSPCYHANGHIYEFEDMDSKVQNKWSPKRLDKAKSESILFDIKSFCKENGVSYCSLPGSQSKDVHRANNIKKPSKSLSSQPLPPEVYKFLKDLDYKSIDFDDPKNSITEGTRHHSFLYIANILISEHYYHNKGSKNLSQLKEIYDTLDEKLSKPPMPTYEKNKLWQDCVNHQKEKHKLEQEDNNSFAKETDSKHPDIENKKQENKTTIHINKYTKDKKIHESIILNNKPVFIAYNSLTNDIDIIANIELNKNEVFVPINKTKINYLPYEFESEDELKNLLKKAKEMSIFDMYYELYILLGNYITDNYYRYLLSFLIIYSYFQDKFATTPYLYIVGDNDTGKTMLGNIISAFAYRCSNNVNPSTASIYRTLGKYEEGQCTFVFDEVDDKIRNDAAIRDILKSGYKKGAKVSRCDTNNNNEPELYFTYCFKVLISETLPEEKHSKGILDRSFVIQTTHQGKNYDETHNISEVMYSNINESYEVLRKKNFSFRKLLLLFRLIHFEDTLPHLQIYGTKSSSVEKSNSNTEENKRCEGMSDENLASSKKEERMSEDNRLENRDKELVKPIFQLFCSNIKLLDNEQNKELVNQLKRVFNEVVSNRYSHKKQNLLVSDVLNTINNIYKDKTEIPDVIEVKFGLFWVELNLKLEGTMKNNSCFISAEHGEVTQPMITKILENRFGFKKQKKSDGSHYYCDRSSFRNLLEKYNIKEENYVYIDKIIVSRDNVEKQSAF